jgi:PAS domain S-box-containing protein
MVVVNEEGTILLLNREAERQFGYHREELLGQEVRAIIPAGFEEQLSAYRAGNPNPQNQAFESLGRRKDGMAFPVEVVLGAVEGQQGNSFIAAIRNVSRRREPLQAEKLANLRHSHQELQEFAYAASHDLQEPLRMVASYTQLLAKRYKGRLDSEADEFISFAVDGTQRMKALIDALLVYSRAGNADQLAIEISSKQALEEALRNLRVAILRNQAVVTYDELPTVTMNMPQLVQVFENLVENAIKYRGAAIPHVHISAVKSSRAEWIFSVRDNGLGIEAQHFKRIFVIFQRLHGREEFEGAGVGLAVCKKIIERHGGKIWVESQPARGSTFYFALLQPEAK